MLTVPLALENVDRPGTYQVQLEAQQDVDEVVTSDDEDVSATMDENASRWCQPQNKQARRHTSDFYKQMKSAWKNMKSVNLFTKLEEDATNSGSQKSASSPQEASAIRQRQSFFPLKRNKVCPVPLEPVDEQATIISSPSVEYCEKRFSVTEDLVKDRDPTPGPLGEK